MSTPAKPTTVRLLELESRAQAAARGAGLALADWIRRAIAQALPAEVEQGDGSRDMGDTVRLTVRVRASDLERWREEAAAQTLSLNRYIATELRVTGEARQRVAHAIDVLAREAAAFAAVGRHLNQIARSLNAFPGQLSESERTVLSQLCGDVARHRASSSALVSELRATSGTRR